jgi:hypothetical protein
MEMVTGAIPGIRRGPKLHAAAPNSIRFLLDEAAEGINRFLHLRIGEAGDGLHLALAILDDAPEMLL